MYCDLKAVMMNIDVETMFVISTIKYEHDSVVDNIEPWCIVVLNNLRCWQNLIENLEGYIY